MDRQLLLEQKRQRLQELKQRRSHQQEQQEKKENEVDEIINTLIKKETIGIDVSTQTIQVKPIKVEDIRYDKAIQTEQQVEVEVEVEVEEKQEQVIPEKQLVGKPELSETKLNQALDTSLKLLNRLTIKSTIELEQPSKTSEETIKGYLHEILTYSGQGSIIDIDISSDLIAIAYSNNKYSAIVYHKTTPQYFLTSISTITTIQFDITNPNRIIVGNSNGSISIYELTSQLSPVVSPTLTTPLYSTSLFKFRIHTTPIILMCQLTINDNNCLLTICKQGIVNLWSVNLLAVPKSSFTLFTNKFISHAIITNQQQYVDSSYLNSLVFVSKGKIYKLNKEMPILQHTTEGISSIITDIIQINSMLITSHMDLNLRIWQGDNCTTIPTPYLVERLVVRPNTSQFVTVAHKPTPKVDLWDFSKRLYTPVINICEYQVDSIKFNTEGDQIILGKNTGFTILSIDEFTIEDIQYDNGI